MQFLPTNVALSFEWFKLQNIMTPITEKTRLLFPTAIPTSHAGLIRTEWTRPGTKSDWGGNNIIDDDRFYTENHTK
jgi:hypothetical protein